MKRTAFCLALALASVLGAPASACQQKVIHDPAEYRAYMAALNTEDPSAKAAAMEAFAAQYPGSVMKVAALEEAMAAYQNGGNSSKVEEKAKQIVDLEPGNVRALAILT